MRRARARGQALVEFALVLPLIFVIFAGVLTLGAFAWNGQVADHASRLGAMAGNDAMAPVNRAVSSDPALSTPWLPGRNDATFPNQCRRTASAALAGAAADPNLPRRLGWDWGCTPAYAGLIAAPLSAAATAAFTAASAPEFIGGAISVTSTACYYSVLASGAVSPCLMRAVKSGAGAPVVTGVSAANAPVLFAPSYIGVTVVINAAQLLGLPPVVITRFTMMPLERWLPPCPAPANSTPTACGLLF
jgi:hypothetical protein